MRNAILVAAALTLPAMVLAQTPPPPPQSGPPPIQRGLMGGGDMLSGVQKDIRATDEEWKVIAPQIRRVINTRRTVEAAGMRQGIFGMSMFGGRGGGAGGGGGPRRQDSFSGPGGGPRGPGAPRGGPGAVPGGETRPAPAPDRPDDTRRPPDRPAADTPPGPGGLGAGPPGGPGGFRPRGGGPGGMGNNPVMLATFDLQTAIADEKTTPEQLKEKMAAVRAARAKAKSNLDEAQAELRELITPDQEAVLVSQGLLD